MSLDYSNLEQIKCALFASFEKEDWDSVEALDSQLTTEVENLVNRAAFAGQNERDALQSMLRDIQSEYQRMLIEAKDKQSELGRQLKQLNNEHKAASRYIDSAKYR
ncbi:hypothetical protein OLMES_3569 [Oleiphilus messinensis]|uniref:Flagellar protein FliT n=1 Tax=Oleiphilus messinensis TaxID=141451 RepID=A0A1Y0IBS0_9GAMM|nr:flagellar protein FliT [Oleiphilus messinensis]ARU57599.1 hypothetical protein OLMES_3569 [Oleiphilus messinensis]